MTTDGPDLARLAELVAARRAKLRLSKDGAAAKARISRITWRKVEDGRAVRDTMYAAAEEALEWEPGSVAAILRGGEPTVVTDSGPQADPDKVTSATEVLRLVLAQFGPEVYEAARQELESELPDTERNQKRKA
jgi:hypothetical protein